MFLFSGGIQRPVIEVPERAADVAGGEAASGGTRERIPEPRTSTPRGSRNTQDSTRIGGIIHLSKLFKKFGLKAKNLVWKIKTVTFRLLIQLQIIICME